MRRKTILLAVVSATVAGMGYGCCYLWTFQQTFGKECSVSCSILHLRDALFDYRSAHKRWPETLAELKLDKAMLEDHVSQRPYLYFPSATFSNPHYAKPSKEYILLAQPETYRLGLWPLAEKRLNVVSTNGARYILYGQEAAAVLTTP